MVVIVIKIIVIKSAKAKCVMPQGAENIAEASFDLPQAGEIFTYDFA
jgi:hypothetical protein